jgi:hypothetical protein
MGLNEQNGEMQMARTRDYQRSKVYSAEGSCADTVPTVHLTLN